MVDLKALKDKTVAGARKVKEAAEDAGIKSPLPGGVKLNTPFGNAAGTLQTVRSALEGKPDYVVQMPKSKTSVEGYYRVDEQKDGTFKATRLEGEKVTDDIKAQAQTPQQLQKVLADANSPTAVRGAIQRAKGFDANISAVNGTPIDTDLDDNIALAAKPANASATRQEIIGELQGDVKEIDTFTKAQMKTAGLTKDDKGAFKDQVNTEIDSLQKIEAIPAVLQAATDAAKPAVKKDFSIAPGGMN